jgi:hypothetical protein
VVLSAQINIVSRKGTVDSEFILDSGCTINLTYDINNLQNFRKLVKRRYIKCASGKRLEIVGVGFIQGIGEVYYVPGAKLNLLSITSLTQAGKAVTFTHDRVFLGGKVIGKLSGKLYVRNTEEDFCALSVAEDEIYSNDNVKLARTESPSMELLHRRYGHTNIDNN